MIVYDHKRWRMMTLVLRGTVVAEIWPRIAFYMAYAATIWAVNQYQVINLPAFGTVAHSLVGVAMGMLLVFRTNASYDRYWEGRKRWGGIINASRNLIRSGRAYVGSSTDLGRLIHGYVIALKQHLRHQKNPDEFRGVCPAHVPSSAMVTENPPAYFAVHISAWIAQRVKSGHLVPELARVLEGYVGELMDHQGACERIVKTPVPFAYVVHVRQLLVLYLLTLPWVMVTQMGLMSVFVTGLLAFALIGIEEAGIEIEDPFGTDANDLPLDDICATIGIDTQQIATIEDIALDKAAQFDADA